MRLLRTLLILGRVSNLPTVWSNCLAGWLLGGAGEAWQFMALLYGASLLYVGGMFLNDAFDVDFDREHRQERPIPSGAISLEAVWTYGFMLVGFGVIALVMVSWTTGQYALALAAVIILYDAFHKQISWSPVLMAACRFFLYLAAASTGASGVNGFVVWCAVVLAAYIVGLSYLARRESAPGALKYWPLIFLFSPVVLAWVSNVGIYWIAAIVVAAVLTAWILRCLYSTLWSPMKNIGETVSGLLAGIVLVDLLAVAGGPSTYGAVFCTLFIAALFFQRLIPAT